LPLGKLFVNVSAIFVFIALFSALLGWSQRASNGAAGRVA
jgi:hypothetical protein